VVEGIGIVVDLRAGKDGGGDADRVRNSALKFEPLPSSEKDSKSARVYEELWAE
jgi:hypothetical protein